MKLIALIAILFISCAATTTPPVMQEKKPMAPIVSECEMTKQRIEASLFMIDNLNNIIVSTEVDAQKFVAIEVKEFTMGMTGSMLRWYKRNCISL